MISCGERHDRDLQAHRVDNRPGQGNTVWSIFDMDSTCFARSKSLFMVNHRVANLHDLLLALPVQGCEVDAKTGASEFGKFGGLMDPEGNRMELWEPPPGAVVTSRQITQLTDSLTVS